MKHRLRKIVQISLLASLGASYPSLATSAMPDTRAFRNAPEVSDLELGMQRGRYMARGKIMYFGVEMLTEWRTARGEVIRAGLNVSVDRHRGQFRPIVHVVPIAEVSRSSSPAADAPTTPGARDAAISSGGLDSVKGVGQIVQVTGDTNRVRNDISLELRSSGDGSGSPGPALQTLSKQANAASPDSGATVHASATSKNFGISVFVPGQGVVTQSITSLNGLRQNVRLSGDLNNVLNQLNLTAEFQATSNPGIQNLRSTHRLMRGLPQQGMY